METHSETCPECQSRALNVLLLRTGGNLPKVFLRCDACKSFVGAYVAREMYHANEEPDHWLAFQGGRPSESGRQVLAHLARTREVVKSDFKKMEPEFDKHADEAGAEPPAGDSTPEAE